MNFTREPIIETIITPREGYKLAVRSTKGEQEEYFVDAVEVVSFGNSFFFRSLERPKPFLVPVSDFQVVEAKETRVVLKNVPPERAIKIGGGREAARPREERPTEAPEEISVGERGEEAAEARPPHEGRIDKKRDRRRHRRRRPDERYEQKEWAEKKESEESPKLLEEAAMESVEKGGGADDETQVSSSIFSTLFPPPPTLISETIGKYKEKDHAHPQRDVLPEQVEKKPEEEKKKEEDIGSDTEQLSRVSTISTEFYDTQSFSSNHVYRLNNFSDHPFLK